MSLKKYFFILILVITMISLNGCNTQDNYLNESKSDFDERMEWWRDAGFGMFIHWGLYAVPAGEYNGDSSHAEWIQETADIPVVEYEKYTALFNPVKFNAREWVKIAKQAGMKYMVITSKHHDGFCLWDSKVSDYDIIDRTPFKRDVLMELAQACKEEGIVFCFYHSIMDWHHPDAQGINHPDYNSGKGPNPNFPNYVENYMKPQLKELVTGYGPLGVLWFDGEWISEWTEEQGKDLYNYVRGLQTDIIINNRVGKGRSGMQGMNEYEDAAGDFGTPEQEILEGASILDWESCMTMNNHWGYNKFDKNFKSTEMLIHNLVDIAAKGGNYLLNVGPTAEGLFPEESIQRLKEIGDWINTNGEVIYNSRGTKSYKDDQGVYYIRSKDDQYIYAVATKWPGGILPIKFAKPESGSSIYLLGYDQPLEWKEIENEGIEITVPANIQNESSRPGAHAWVFKMRGKPAKVVEQPEFQIAEKPVELKILFSEPVEVKLIAETEGSDIYTTIDGSAPTIKSGRYDGPIRIEKSLTLKAMAVKSGMVNSLVNKLQLFKASKFKSITYEKIYSPKYSGLGNLTLGDSEFGGLDYNNKKWLGFEMDDMIAVIDLGSLQSIQKLSASFLHDINPWIFSPVRVNFFISSDGKNYKNVAQINSPISLEDNMKQSVIFEKQINPENTRFIKVIAKNIGICPDWHKAAGGKAWLFVDEIIVN